VDFGFGCALLTERLILLMNLSEIPKEKIAKMVGGEFDVLGKDEGENTRILFRLLGMEQTEEQRLVQQDGLQNLEQKLQDIDEKKTPSQAGSSLNLDTTHLLHLVVDYNVVDDPSYTVNDLLRGPTVASDDMEMTNNMYQLFNDTNPFGPQLLMEMHQEDVNHRQQDDHEEFEARPISSASTSSSDFLFSKSSSDDDSLPGPWNDSGFHSGLSAGTISPTPAPFKSAYKNKNKCKSGSKYGRSNSSGSRSEYSVGAHSSAYDMFAFMSRFSMGAALRPRSTETLHNNKYFTNFERGTTFVKKETSSGTIATARLAQKQPRY